MTHAKSLLIAVIIAGHAGAQVPGMPIARGKDSATITALFMRHANATGMTVKRDTGRFMHFKQQMEMGGAPPVEMEFFMVLPLAGKPASAKMLSRVNMPGMGVMETVVNGNDGWVVSPMTGAMLLGADQVRDAVMSGIPDPLASMPKGTVTLASRATLDGREMDGVRVVDSLGSDVVLYFDIKTGLASAVRSSSMAGMAQDTSMVMLFGDYKPFGGTLMPTKMTMRQGSMETMVVRLTQMDRAPMDTMMFVPPPAVVDLLKKRTP